MEMDKQELDIELRHKQALIRALKARRRPLEVQAVRKGINVDAEVVVELQELTRDIQSYEEEVKQLEILAAVDKEPLAEVEYRALLAEVWDTPKGRPKFVGISRLELSRLRLGILPERAQVLEREVRASLARETCLALDVQHTTALLNLEFNWKDYALGHIDEQSPQIRAALLIGRAIRLDLATTVEVLADGILPEVDIPVFGATLMFVNNIVNYNDETILFEQFLMKIKVIFEAHQSTEDIPV